MIKRILSLLLVVLLLLAGLPAYAATGKHRLWIAKGQMARLNASPCLLGALPLIPRLCNDVVLTPILGYAILCREVIQMEHPNIMNAPKTATFQMRISPEVKSQAEQLFASCGLTLTDAINVFLQQSMNAGGLPFVVTQNSREALRDQAIAQLMSEIQAGRDSVKSESDWVSEEEMLARFGVTK